MMSPTATMVPSRRSTREKEVMPEHWRLDNFPGPPWFAALCRAQFIFLCLISFGHTDLDKAWEVCTSDEETWTVHKNQVSDRISTNTVVTGLLLGATAAFTTTPAPLPEILNYSLRGPYLCIFCSFGITLGGLIAGSTVLFVMSKCEAIWFRETLMASRLKVCCTLFTVGYPFCCTGAATIVLSFGLLTAAWLSQDNIIRIGGAFLMVVPGSLALIFVWTQLAHLARQIRERACRDDDGSVNAEVEVAESPLKDAI